MANFSCPKPDDATLAQLKTGLREAIKYRGRDDREAAGIALGAVVDFLLEQKHLTEENLHLPLFDLLAALQDLTTGRLAKMLKPRRFGNRPPDGAVLKRAKGWAVAVVEELVRRGSSTTEACRSVSAVWNKATPSTQRSAETVRSWHRRSSQLSDSDPQRVALAALRQDARLGLETTDPLATLQEVLSKFSIGE